jgi:hypothetical protein
MNETATLDCGHPPSEHSDFTTGYGTDDQGKRSCYDCCAKQERAAMIKTGRGTLYLTSAAANGRMCDFLTDWPGKLRFQAFNVTKSRGYGFGRRYDIVCGSFVGPDDYIWSFRNAGDMHLARCKRTKRYGRPLFEIVDLGVDYPDYFQGFGTSYTKFDHSTYGVGNTAQEAYDDALDSATCYSPQAEIDLKAMPKRPGFSGKVLKRDGDDALYYVGIRWNHKIV